MADIACVCWDWRAPALVPRTWHLLVALQYQPAVPPSTPHPQPRHYPGTFARTQPTLQLHRFTSTPTEVNGPSPSPSRTLAVAPSSRAPTVHRPPCCVTAHVCRKDSHLPTTHYHRTCPVQPLIPLLPNCRGYNLLATTFQPKTYPATRSAPACLVFHHGVSDHSHRHAAGGQDRGEGTMRCWSWPRSSTLGLLPQPHTRSM